MVCHRVDSLSSVLVSVSVLRIFPVISLRFLLSIDRVEMAKKEVKIAFIILENK